eukprot:472639_1
MSAVSTSICTVFIAFFTLLMGQSQHCYNASECVGTEWISSGSILGYGYKSLSGINTSVNGGDYVRCYGAFSCSQMLFLLIDNHIYCHGSHSCADIAGSSYIKAQYIYCYGANACQHSNITSNSEVHCDGDQSC